MVWMSAVERITCEISFTSGEGQELGKIEKCLKVGYEKVILCSPEKKTLEKVKTLVSKRLKDSEKEKVLFFEPQ